MGQLGQLDGGQLLRGVRALMARVGDRLSLLSCGLVLELPKDSVIFDLGIDDGLGLLALWARGYRRLSGHELALLPQHSARLRRRGITVTDGDFLQHEYPSASYDCIRIGSALALTTEPLPTVQKCLRMLKPSGVLIVKVPRDQHGWLCLERAHNLTPSGTPCHVYHHTELSLRALLSAAGFRDLQTLAPGSAASFAAIYDGMRRQAGKSALPALVHWVLLPGYRLTRLWGQPRRWSTLVAREPAQRAKPVSLRHRRLRSAWLARL